MKYRVYYTVFTSTVCTLYTALYSLYTLLRCLFVDHFTIVCCHSYRGKQYLT